MTHKIECVFVSRQKRRLEYFALFYASNITCVAAMELSVFRAQALSLAHFFYLIYADFWKEIAYEKI